MPSLKIVVEDTDLLPESVSSPPLSPASDIFSAAQPVSSFLRLASAAWRGMRHGALLLMAAVAGIAVVGYHPYSEDAGIYIAGIKQAVHPGLYGSGSAFISPYFRWSLFPNFNAWVLEVTHLPLSDLLFVCQIATTWLLLYAVWELAALCFQRTEERWGAVLLTVACLPVPVAGSALFLMDPYLTGRSFSTPLALLAMSACLRGRILHTVSLLLLVGLFHPLMAIYAAGFALLLWAVNREQWAAVAGLMAASIGTGALLQLSQAKIVESPAYVAAVYSRYYYFLYRWQWYELIGLAAPLALFAAYWRWQRSRPQVESVVLAKTCVVAGLSSIAISLLFARPASSSHLISALQTIRPFLWIYYCMFFLLGSLLARFWLRRKVWRWAIFFAASYAGMASVQHRIYAGSPQLEVPWAGSKNGWYEAFIWIREHTPHDALFALDADYMHIPGENGQGFRAIAERNALADQSKDGGAAAAFPELAERWWSEHTATTGLNEIDDLERRRRLTPYGVDWIVLTTSASTSLPCPFADDAVKVCRLQ